MLPEEGSQGLQIQREAHMPEGEIIDDEDGGLRRVTAWPPKSDHAIIYGGGLNVPDNAYWLLEWLNARCALSR